MSRSWAELPRGRVVSLYGASAEAVMLAIDPLPDDAPAIVGYAAGRAGTAAEMVASVLGELEKVAAGLFPAWLPGAEGVAPGGAGVRAVRSLALRLASGSDHFGPFLADLAEGSLRGEADRRRAGFAPEVRVAGLARVLAAGFGRPYAAVLVRVPEGLGAHQEDALFGAAEWLAYRGDLGVWLAGAPLRTVDRAITIAVPAEVARIAAPEADEPSAPPAVTYPAIGGLPHPGSTAEQLLEAALAPCAWAAGRLWNHVYRPDPLAAPIRVDLMWREERCVVEIDGPDHRGALKFAADRQRDVRLQLDGYAVLRFTNSQVLTDTKTVVRQMERFLRGRRVGSLEGRP